MSAEFVWLDEEAKNDLKVICDYLELNEKKHYSESRYPKDHIWRNVKRIKKLLKNLKVMLSRQRHWQKKKLSQGLCIICGKEKIFKGHRCKKHYKPFYKRVQEWQKRNPDSLKKWRKKHPKYMKEWRKKHPNYMKEGSKKKGKQY
jgi:hypothetical protein